jgi:hypothetical protein
MRFDMYRVHFLYGLIKVDRGSSKKIHMLLSLKSKYVWESCPVIFGYRGYRKCRPPSETYFLTRTKILSSLCFAVSKILFAMFNLGFLYDFGFFLETSENFAWSKTVM